MVGTDTAATANGKQQASTANQLGPTTLLPCLATPDTYTIQDLSLKNLIIMEIHFTYRLLLFGAWENWQ
jgi:hypothetical protein